MTRKVTSRVISSRPLGSVQERPTEVARYFSDDGPQENPFVFPKARRYGTAEVPAKSLVLDYYI